MDIYSAFFLFLAGLLIGGSFCRGRKKKVSTGRETFEEIFYDK